MNFAKFKALTAPEKSFLGLPFLIAALVAAYSTQVFDYQILWVFPSFLAARMCGMALNHAMDRAIDVKNPRTAQRVVASGALSARAAYAVAVIALGVFLFSAFQLGTKVMGLAIVGTFLICIYSLLKRVTASCHFVLGLIHFLLPMTAYLAARGSVTIEAFLLSSAAFFSIAGSDILYAIQDYAFDRKEGLHSIPARFGCSGSFYIALSLHLLAVGSVIGFGIASQAGLLFLYGAPLTLLAFLFIFYTRFKASPKFGVWVSTVAGSTMLFFMIAELLCRK